jgi:hypothetical protein
VDLSTPFPEIPKFSYVLTDACRESFIPRLEQGLSSLLVRMEDCVC